MKTSLAICLLAICTAYAQWVPIGQNTNTGATTIDAQLNALGTVPSNTTGNIAYLTHDGRATGAPSNATWKTIPVAFAPGAWTHVWSYSPTTNAVSSNDTPGVYYVTNPPAGAVAAKVQCWGGAGGGGFGAVAGDNAEQYFTPAAGSTVEVWVAQGGWYAATVTFAYSDYAYPGGGMGAIRYTATARYAGGGGGWSGIRENGTWIVLAGGGGGAGYNVAGGAAGYPSGTAGGGTAGGGGGGPASGGAAGSTNATPGTALLGGNGDYGVSGSIFSGGGGGGWYGGGGAYTGGGGGGSSYLSDPSRGAAGWRNVNDANYASGVGAGTLYVGGSGLVVLSFYVP